MTSYFYESSRGKTLCQLVSLLRQHLSLITAFARVDSVSFAKMHAVFYLWARQDLLNITDQLRGHAEDLEVLGLLGEIMTLWSSRTEKTSLV